MLHKLQGAGFAEQVDLAPVRQGNEELALCYVVVVIIIIRVCEGARHDGVVFDRHWLLRLVSLHGVSSS